MNEQPSPEFEKEMRATLNAPQANPTFVRDLRAELLERSAMKTNHRSYRPLAWGLALVLLLSTLVLVAPAAAEALQRLFGYVPGVGFVQPSDALRVLAKPVTLTKDGLTVTITNGAADEQRTVILFTVSGYPTEQALQPVCEESPRLRLPDGTVLKQQSSEHGVSDLTDPQPIYHARHVFEALPVGVLDATLEIPCLLYNPQYPDYVFDLHFDPADETQVLPVIALPTAATPLTQPEPATVDPGSASIEGFTIVLESETQLPDGYLLTGSYQWTDPRFDGFSAYPSLIILKDANGNDVPLEFVDSAEAQTDPAVKKLPFAFHIPGKEHAFPLTLAVDNVIATLPDTGTFQFDFGADPQIGQVWDVSLDVPIAGHVLHIERIELTGGRTAAEVGYTFTITSDEAVSGANVTDANPVLNLPAGGGGGGGGGGMDSGIAHGPFTTGFALAGYQPAGLKTFTISGLSLSISGPWQVTWQPAK